jgi:hypothetical protein
VIFSLEDLNNRLEYIYRYHKRNVWQPRWNVSFQTYTNRRVPLKPRHELSFHNETKKQNITTRICMWECILCKISSCLGNQRLQLLRNCRWWNCRCWRRCAIFMMRLEKTLRFILF